MKKGKTKLKCNNCGKEFLRFNSQLPLGKRHYCSEKCQYEGMKRGSFINCSFCGKKIWKRPYLISKHTFHYCSRKCRNKVEFTKEHRQNISKSRIGKFSGKDHPNWKGGISLDPYSFNFDDNLKEMIRKRDNYTCQECGYTEQKLGYKLSIHHIDYNKVNSNNNNLISLCKSCHSKTNFDRKDWVQYFQNKVIN